MIPTLTTLLKTVTGKIVIGVTVATMSVGAAAAASGGLPMISGAESPSLQDPDGPSATKSDDDQGEDEQTEADETDDEQTEADETDDEQGDSDARDDTDEERQAAPAAADEQEPVADDATEAPNHGAVVSEFTRNTLLTGCEKGQATAAVARGDVDPNAATDLEAELAPYIAKCSKGDVEEIEDPAADIDAESADLQDWKGVRDETKAAWLAAKDDYVAACGDDDDTDEEGAAAEVDAGEQDADTELSPECQAMKAELKTLHETGKAEWKAARDAEHDARKAEGQARRADKKAERSSHSSQGSSHGKKSKDG